MKSKNLRGLLQAFAAFMLWSFCDALAKGATDYNVAPYQMMLIASLASFFGLTAVSATQNRLKKFKPQAAGLVWARAVFYAIIVIFDNLAFARLSLASFYVVAFSCPMLVAVGGRVFLKEKVSMKKALIIVLGFLGVVVAVDPRAIVQGDIDGWGVLFCLSGAVCFASSQLLLRHLSGKEPIESLMATSFVSQIIAGLVALLFHCEAVPLPAVLCLVASGLLSVPANFMMVKAMQKITAASAGALQYTQLIPGATLGYLIWGHVPSLNLILGAAIIVVSGIAMAQYEKTRSKKAELLAH